MSRHEAKQPDSARGPMTEAELERAADAVGALLEVIHRGELYVLPATVHRLEGARLVLELLAHGETDLAALLGRLQDPAAH